MHDFLDIYQEVMSPKPYTRVSLGVAVRLCGEASCGVYYEVTFLGRVHGLQLGFRV